MASAHEKAGERIVSLKTSPGAAQYPPQNYAHEVVQNVKLDP